MENSRKWKNVELKGFASEQFGQFLYDNCIEFESSECYDLVHFEVCVDDYETAAVNDFLNELEEI